MPMGLKEPSWWHRTSRRPAFFGPDVRRSIAREFLSALAGVAAASRPIGLRVPSVLSNSDCNVLIDPSRKSLCSGSLTHGLPFSTLLTTSS